VGVSKRFAFTSAILGVIATAAIQAQPAYAQTKPDSGVAPANSTTPPGKSPAAPKPEPPPPPPGKDARAAARARTDKGADYYMEAWRKLKETLCSGDHKAILQARYVFEMAREDLESDVAEEASIDQAVDDLHQDSLRADDAYTKLNANAKADESAVQAAKGDASRAYRRWDDARKAKTAAINKRLEANGIDFYEPKAA
jgi:hypothetical protein